jgi:hypothetical protein
MWKQLFDFGKQLFSLTQETRQNKAEIAGVQQEIKEVREELRTLTELKSSSNSDSRSSLTGKTRLTSQKNWCCAWRTQ